MFSSVRRWRRSVVVAMVAAVCVIAAVVVLLVAPDRDDGDEGGGAVAAAFAESDPIPTGRTVEVLPQRCGVSKGTTARLVPKPRRAPEAWARTGTSADCTWVTGRRADALGEGTHGLEVSISLADDVDPDSSSTAPRVFAASFPKPEDEETRDTVSSRSGRVKPVHGLGHEAATWDLLRKDKLDLQPRWRRFTNVLFREGNVVIHVGYGGLSRSKKRPMARRTAYAGAVETAREVAQSMRLTAVAKPRLGAQSTQTVERTPPPCAAVPHALASDLGFEGGGIARAPSQLDIASFSASKGCHWTTPVGPSDELTVDLAYPDDSLQGTAADRAARAYRSMHEQARSTAEHHALTKPGEQAFVTYAIDDTSKSEQVTIVFRTRNALVRVFLEVDTWDEDAGEYRYDKYRAMNDAFRLAVAAAKHFDT